MGKGSVRTGAILTSALLLSVYARVELPWAWLGWFALVPWIAALERERTMFAVAASGMAMSMAFAVGVFGWLADSFARYTQAPEWLAYALLLVAAPLLQPQFMVFAAVRRTISVRGGRGLVASVAAALAWVGAEWLRPRLLGDTLGQGLLPFATFRQGADLAGASGLTLTILIVNQQLYAAAARWRGPVRQVLWPLATATAVICALAGYGALRLHRLERWESPRPPLTAALVQASLGDYSDLRARLGTFATVRHILDVHMQLSRAALDRAASEHAVDLLVWPETVYPTTFGAPKSEAGAELDGEISGFVESSRVPLLFGTYTRDAEGEYNAAILLAPPVGSSLRPGVYRKRRLFPLTEVVPSWLDSASLRRRAPWLGTWLPGDGPPILTLRSAGRDLKLAAMICLDAVDPGLARDAARQGAEVIVTLSNDGWFAAGGGARLHLTVAAFRSIETRLPQFRATNTGISAFISAEGEIVEEAAVGESTALIATVAPGRRAATLIVRWGDWLGPAACLLAPLVALCAIFLRPSE